jgi:septal ring factor EnvC (AmiA/AmiB activator)
VRDRRYYLFMQRVASFPASSSLRFAFLHPILLSRSTLLSVLLRCVAGTAREAELAVGQCEAKLSEQRQTITSLESVAASISRVKAEAAAAQHERDAMSEQLSAALAQTRRLEVACQEWVAEVQREARMSMSSSSSPRGTVAADAAAGARSPAGASGAARLAAHRAARAEATATGMQVTHHSFRQTEHASTPRAAASHADRTSTAVNALLGS